MSRFLRFCAFLSVLFFTTNVFAAGYSCPTYKKYTSCSAGYYMTNSSGTTYNGTPAVGNLCTICPKGYYCTGGTANKVACSAGRYGSSTGLRTSACSGVIAAGRYGSAGATSANGSGAVSAGYYSSGGGTSATPTAAGNGCLSGYKCGKVSTGCYGSAGATTDCPNGCPAGYQAGEGTTAQSNCLASCAAGTRVATANAACSAITSGNVYMLAHTVKYGQTSEEATRCPSNYTISGTTQADHDAKDDCKITCSAGTRVTTADATCSSISSSTGYYITSHTVSAGYTSPAATQCPENYRTGAGTTAQSNCLASCAAGSRVATANEACSAITSGNVYMLAHTVKYGATSAAATSCPSSYTISGTTQADHDAKSDCKISCNAGYAVLTADATCSTIQNSTYKGKYTASHTVSAGSTSTISTCPANYQTGNGAAGQANCTTSCAAGSRVATANEACSAITSGNVYMLAHTVKYGATSAAATSCPSSYTISGTTQADHDAKADCKITCSAGTRVTTADATCSSISSSTGYYITSHTVSAGSTSPAATQCPENYRAGAGTTSEANCSLTTTAGKYVATAGAGETACISPYYCPGGTTIKYGTGTTTGGNSACTALGAIYSKSDAGASANTKCYATTTSTKWVASAKASSESTCTAGYYCAGGTKVYYNSTGGRTACGGGKYSAEGATSCSNITAGCYGTSASSACPAVCAANTYSNAGASACTACDSDYANSGDTAESHAGVASCKVTCAAGTYVASSGAACTDVGSGYYTTASQTISQGSTGSRSACSSLNAFYTASDSGRDATTDCFGTTTSGKFVKTAKSGEETCTAGGYCAGSVKVYYNSTGGRTACGAGTKNASTGSSSSSACTACAAGTYSTGGASSCSTVNDGCYGGASATSACPNSCSSLNSFYTKSDNGRDANTDCYGTTTSGNWIKTQKSGQVTCDAGGYCPGSVKVYYNSTGGRTGCGAGKYNASTGSSSSSACSNITAGCYGTSASSACPAVCAANKWSAAGASSCTSCPTDYENSGDTAASHADQSSCKITVDGGYYIGTAGDNSSNWDKCAGGTYKASHTVAYGGTSSCATCSAGYYCPEGASGQTPCGGNTKYSSSGAASCSTVSTGYYTTGGTSTTRTGQTKCEAGNYCSGGVKTECGGGKYSAEGATSCSNITAGCYGTSASSSCPAVCGANKYSDAGASSCTSCPTDYKNSGDTATAHAGSASCIITVSGGYYIGTAGDNSSNWDKCSAGYYKAAHSVAYGSTSSCSACGAVDKYSAAGASACSTVDTGYYTTGGTTTTRTGQLQCKSGTYCTGGVQNTCPSGYGASAAGSDAAADCYMSVAATKYVKAANDSSASACGTGTYKAAHTVYYGGTSTCSSCPSGYDDGAAVATQAECVISVAGGKYVGTANSATLSTCAGGTYKAAHSVAYGSTSSCGQCPANSYCPEGASAATACSTLASGFYPNSAAGSDAATDCKTNSLSGKYVASKNATSATSCAAGTFKGAHIVNYGSTSSCDACALGSYSAAGASACTACQSGKTTSGTGKSSCDATCENNNSYASTWATATWSDNAVANLCQIATCAGGSKYTSANGEATGTLPSGYTQLAYLESTGTQYIDTGIVYARFVHDIQFTNQASTGSLMGKSAGGGMYWGQARSGSAGYEGPGGAIRNIDPTDRHIVEFGALAGQKTYLNIGDTTITGSTNASSSTYSLLGISGYEMYRCEAKLYDVKAYDENDALISHLIPVRRNSDGVLGMYDTVNNRFLVNAGSGTFVAGFAILKSQNTCTQCSAGTYSAGGTATSCGTCPANSYCPAGASAATACSTLASGFYPNSAAGSGAATDCKTNSLSGKYVASANATSATTCSCGTYKAAHTVAYGSTSSCTTTSAGYYAAEGASSQTQADPGYYAAAGACEQTKIQAGCFGGEGSASACPNSCPAAESGWTLASTTGLTVVTDCAEITTPSTSGSPIATICTAGTLTKKATNSTTWGSATASGLTAKAGRYVNGTTCSACSAGTYTSSATTATSCTPAAAGYYVSGTGATSQTACPAGTYQSSTGKTSCSDAAAGTYTTGCKDTTNNKACTGTSVCADGKYSDKKASSCTACTIAKGYTNSGTTAASHAGAASCKVTCGAGQYVASAGAGCANVTAGFWGAGGTVPQTATLARTACDSGLTTIGYGTGANEAADCGRKLHAGDNVIYLRSAERTSPSLRVKVGDKTFFGALSTALSGALKVKNGSTTYSVVNDYQ